MIRPSAGAIKRSIALLLLTLLSTQDSSKFVLLDSANAAASDYPIYSDELSSGWANWSWASNINFSDSTNPNSGSKDISFTSQANFGALYLHSDGGIDTRGRDNLVFAARASTTGQKFSVFFYDGGDQDLGSHQNLADYGGDPENSGWKTYSIPLNRMGAADKTIKGLAIQDIGTTHATLYLDEIKLGGAGSGTTTTPVTPSAPATVPTPTAPVTPTPVPAPTPVQNSADSYIYRDALVSGWSNWSWGSDVKTDDSQSPNAGSKDIAYKSLSQWSGLYLHTDAGIDTTKYTTISFAARSSLNSQKFKLLLYDSGNQPIGNGINFSDLGGDPTPGTWKVYDVPLDKLGANSRAVKGFLIQDIAGVADTLYIDEIKLAGPSQSTTPAPAPTLPPTPVTLPIGNVGGYTTANGSIYKDGAKVTLHGINWFGMETDTHVVHGLWARGYKDVISQIKNLGFNSVRLPFCPASVTGVATTSIDYSKNPDLNGLDSLQVLDKIVAEMSNQGIYSLLDSHRPDCNAQSDLWYTGSYSESAWVSDLKALASRYSGVSHFIGLDLKNEPHGAATWGTGNTATDWNSAAEKAGRAVLSVNPNILVFVEGIGDNPSCQDNYGHFWGGNLAPVKCAPISPNMIPSNKLVYSPHVYGPDVSYQGYFGDPSFPSNMPQIWDAQFGYLTGNGFTLAPGEWGGKYGNGGKPEDVTWQNALVSYLKSKKICSSYYWDLNPNSGDTGGLLQDDWSTPWANKLNLLQGYFNGCTQ